MEPSYLDILVQLVKVLGRYCRPGTAIDYARTGLDEVRNEDVRERMCG